ncbi:MAG: hypothetical protein V4710_18710 [Verrucomicrobiota bacterium]
MKWKAFFLCALVLGVLGVLGGLGGLRGRARAAEAGKTEEAVEGARIPSNPATWRVWLEPKFMHAPVSAAIPGAQQTEMVAGLHEDALFGDVTLSKARFESLKVGWAEFLQRARVNADALKAGLKPRYVRDRKRVIEYAVLSSSQPVVATAVFGSRFLELFKETLGEKVLLVVPNRYTAFVFPVLASNYQEYAPMVLEAYKATAFPVSLEVFELSAEGWKTVGVYEP